MSNEEEIARLRAEIEALKASNASLTQVAVTARGAVAQVVVQRNRFERIAQEWEKISADNFALAMQWKEWASKWHSSAEELSTSLRGASSSTPRRSRRTTPRAA